ncbi:tetratricopeptide repeat-containing sensor histidine kinase [Saccharicrinis carchari]|nr:tetratricopeptide repeat-containing sensor histidine kinase [Saccharicrinis carchari]
MLFLLYPTGSLYAQEKVDSLKALLLCDISDSAKADVYQELGYETLYKSHSEAMLYFTKANQFAINAFDTLSVFYSLVGMCDVYSTIGEYKQAADCITKAIKLISDNDYTMLAYSYGRLATIYAGVDNDSLSFVNDRKSLYYNRLQNDSLSIAYDYNNIAGHFSEAGKADSAVYYYNKSFAYLPDTFDNLYAYNLSGLGYLYGRIPDVKKSLTFHQRALKLYKAKELTYDMALDQYYIADMYYLSGNLDSATVYSEKSLEKSKKLRNHDLLKRNYHLLNKLYHDRMDFKEAANYSRLELLYTDSINQKNKENIILSLKSKYELEEQSRQLEEAERHNAILAGQRTLFLILSLLIFILLVISIVVLIKNKKEQKANAELVKRLDKTNSYISKLLSIISHDLRNSVGNLNNFTQLMHHRLLDNKSIKLMLSKFVPMVDSTHSLLDTLLTWSESNTEVFKPKIEKVSLKQVVQLCIDQLGYLGKAKQISLESTVEDTFVYADKNMLLVVLRNLVSNAIKFSESGSLVKIEAAVKDENVEFIVRDKGVGMSEEEIVQVLDQTSNYHSAGTNGERGSGLGLSLCSSFISRHDGQLKIQSTKGKGSTFSFVIPQRSNINKGVHS